MDLMLLALAVTPGSNSEKPQDEPSPKPQGRNFAVEIFGYNGQAVYKSRMVPLSVRIRCAVEALPFESPKLSATAVLTSEDFADRLKKPLPDQG